MRGGSKSKGKVIKSLLFRSSHNINIQSLIIQKIRIICNNIFPFTSHAILDYKKVHWIIQMFRKGIYKFFKRFFFYFQIDNLTVLVYGCVYCSHFILYKFSLFIIFSERFLSKPPIIRFFIKIMFGFLN